MTEKLGVNEKEPAFGQKTPPTQKTNGLTVLETSTGTHPFFSHQQTPEGRDVTPFYVGF